jgi:hypothetical protein
MMGLVAFAANRLALDHFMEDVMRATLGVPALTAAFFLASWPCPAPAQTTLPPEQQQPAFTSGERVSAGQQFFGTSQWGLPNGYVLGEEAGGAFFGGL